LVQVHVSLSSLEAEVEYLEDLSHRLVPLLLRRRVAAIRLQFLIGLIWLR
jgi:hypothetical protein